MLDGVGATWDFGFVSPASQLPGRESSTWSFYCSLSFLIDSLGNWLYHRSYIKKHVKRWLNQDFSLLFSTAMKFRTNTILCMEITTWRTELFISHLVFPNGTKMKSCVLFILLFPVLFMLAFWKHTAENSNLQQYSALLHHHPCNDLQRLYERWCT